jgi:hypothetical protein
VFEVHEEGFARAVFTHHQLESRATVSHVVEAFFKGRQFGIAPYLNVAGSSSGVTPARKDKHLKGCGSQPARSCET